MKTSQLSVLPSTGHHTPCGTDTRKKMDACLCTFNGQTFLAIGECSQHDAADQCGLTRAVGGTIKCRNKYLVPFWSGMMNISSRVVWSRLLNILDGSRLTYRNRLQVNTNTHTGRQMEIRQRQTDREDETSRDAHRQSANTQRHRQNAQDVSFYTTRWNDRRWFTLHPLTSLYPEAT